MLLSDMGEENMGEIRVRNLFEILYQEAISVLHTQISVSSRYGTQQLLSCFMFSMIKGA
jgi:hypothetical protein